jgi:hypothetical protein
MSLGAKAMSSKIKIKIGNIEFEYEGETEFSQDDIKDLFSHLETLSVPAVAVTEAAQDTVVEKKTPNGAKIHTSTIATRLGGKGASNLAIASAAHLQIVQGKESFTRQELLSDMRSATTHYNKNMSTNHSKTLASLVTQQVINQISADSYSLSSGKMAELEALIAQ